VRALDALEALRYAPRPGAGAATPPPSARRLADDALRALAALEATGALRVTPAHARAAIA